MEKLIIFALFLSSCNMSSGNSDAVTDYYAVTINFQNDELIKNIQTKIYGAFVQSIMNKDATELDNMANALESLQKEQSNNLIQYWRAYNQYYLSILYTTMEDKEQSKAHIEKGIDIMSNLKNKNSEDYALLALLQSFSIQFKSGIGAGFMSNKVKKNAQKAKEMDATNLRAYFVLGSSDYYTPATYGGGKKTEEYLLKALDCPDQKVENLYLPSWGREVAYEILLKHYIKNEEWDKAKSHFQNAKSQFPNSYAINNIASELVGK
ncbi:MAG: hypothetical protein AAFO07_26905 [Bacteroidota bacterium]